MDVDYESMRQTMRMNSAKINSIIPRISELESECERLSQEDIASLDSIIGQLRTLEHSLFWRYFSLNEGD